MVMRKITTMILLRYIKFFGVFLSVKVFLKSLSAEETLLLEIAREKLGSSFFVQWCRLYLDWKAKQKA
jgi:hypothetical protein